MSYTNPPYSKESIFPSDTAYSGESRSREFGSRTSLSVLPSLPVDLKIRKEKWEEEEKNEEEGENSNGVSETSFVEFDLSHNSIQGGRKTESIPRFSERRISIGSNSIKEKKEEEIKETQTEKENDPKAEYDDFFNSENTNWKSMKTVTEHDYYNEKGELEYTSSFQDPFDAYQNTLGYTRIDTEEQIAKYSKLDKETDFLFQSVTSGEESDEDEDEDAQNEDMFISSNTETIQSTKTMLSDAQKFAYVGIIKLITVDMATDLAKLKFSKSGSIAKLLSANQKNFANWTLYIMAKLYDHLELSKEEQNMIEKMSNHGLQVEDLSQSLLGIDYFQDNENASQNPQPKINIGWVLICDLSLLLLSDGYYDSRSRSLLLRFGSCLDISDLKLHQFERRLIECIQLETKTKTIDGNDEKLNDKQFVDKYIKKNKKKRMAFIGLATVGGSLAIGLSAGLLAPVIGAGLAAGLTTVGITGTSGFLAGVGGSAIITTGGIFAGAQIGSKAGSRRVGDVNTFELKPLHNNRRTNLIVTVSGWMNGDLDDVRLPFSTVDPVMGDMFSLLWEPEMLKSMGQTISILASEALSTSIQQILGATILTALMSAIQLPMALSKLSYILDNPWNVSLDRAWKAGKILADTIISGNLGVRPITLVGFSLGSRLIYSCLIELAERGGLGLVENVVLLGCPIAVKNDQMALARSVVSGKFYNCYSKRDWILGYLFRATSGGLSSVAGLSPIPEFLNIENVDCTDLVDGHMAYRKAVGRILKNVGWEMLSEEFAEIEEPDPEQAERTRKLIMEFDEARANMIDEKQNKAKKKTWKDLFKPKPKDWWDVYEAPDNEGSSKEAEASRKDSEEQEEYKIPIFDVSALQSEVNKIEDMTNQKTSKKSDEQS